MSGKDELTVMLWYGLFLLAIVVMMKACAVNREVVDPGTGFETVQVSDERAEEILKQVNLIRIYAEPESASMTGFDVNEEGSIAIGFRRTNDKAIGIYDSEGIFRYGYRFQTSGAFRLELDQEDLILYLVRGDFMIRINPEGDVELVADILDTRENNTYANYLDAMRKKTVGDRKYVMRKNLGILNGFAFSYSQLVMIGADGEETIIYDVSLQNGIKTVLILTVILLMVGYWLKVELPKRLAEEDEVPVRKEGSVKE